MGLVAEAIACSTPVVASDVGGLKYTAVPQETGLLAPPKNEAVFADAIDRLLVDSVWRQQLGQTGRQRVKTLFQLGQYRLPTPSTLHSTARTIGHST
ncbi:glycosyltransferase [Microcoleus sp. N3A4]|uniref:glycosyltransferase n=1 Tax=Microcoleus sp. N3A4 TaxID=3055379 RepID=UPI002FCEED83